MIEGKERAGCWKYSTRSNAQAHCPRWASRVRAFAGASKNVSIKREAAPIGGEQEEEEEAHAAEIFMLLVIDRDRGHSVCVVARTREIYRRLWWF